MIPRSRLLLGLLACGILSSAAVQAAPMIGLASSGTTINPGDSFSVSLTLSNDLPGGVDIIGYDFFLRASDDDAFTLTSRAYTSPLTTLNTPSGLLTLPQEVTTTGLYQNDGATLANLGATDPTEIGFGSGTTTIVTLTFTLAPTFTTGATPTLTFYNNGPFFVNGSPALSDNDFPPGEYQYASPLTFTVTVVPESSAMALAGLAGASLLVSRRTRSRSGFCQASVR